MSTNISNTNLGSIYTKPDPPKKISKEINKTQVKSDNPTLKDKLVTSPNNNGKVTPSYQFHDKLNHSSSLVKEASVKTGIVIAEYASKSIAKKTIGASLGKIIVKSSTVTAKAVIKSLSENVFSTVVSTAVEEVAVKIVEKGATKAAAKGGTKAASRLSAAVPFVGALVSAGFTIMDTKLAYDLTKDKKVSKLSAALAWGTVGLDIVSTVTTATGVGSLIGWVATGLSIGTGIGSDLTK
ncbi:MAG: hypothetical protein H7263_07160 [Candidatus Sericytochromatia bacterium]|nr:hypothetical protein [Candidatus Sericytochromatia bacterium]